MHFYQYLWLAIHLNIFEYIWIYFGFGTNFKFEKSFPFVVKLDEANPLLYNNKHLGLKQSPAIPFKIHTHKKTDKQTNRQTESI